MTKDRDFWTPNSHFAPLDGVRGMAILLVLIFHFFLFMAASSEFDRGVRLITNFGWVGVDLFFVLSGFLITNILLNLRSEQSYFIPFYARRCLRIFPVYYCFLLLMGALIGPMFVWWSATDAHIHELNVFNKNLWWYVFYGTNILIVLRSLDATPLWLNVFWSLAVEEQFYMVWPAFVRWLSPKRLLLVGAFAVVIAPVLRIAIWFAHPGSGINRESLAVLVLTPTRIDTLAMGALVAILARDKIGIQFIRKIGPLVGLISITVIALIMVARGGYSAFDGWVQTVGYTANGLLAASLIGLSVTTPRESKVNRVLSTEILRKFGVYSYAIYIIHSPIFWVFDRAVFGRHIPTVLGSRFPFFLSGFLLMTLIVVGVAFISWHVMERRFLALKVLFPMPSSKLGATGEAASAVKMT